MDSEEGQDLIIENINKLKKQVELLSKQPRPATPSSQQETIEDDNDATQESHQDIVSSVASSQSTSMHDSNVVNESSVTSVDNQSVSNVDIELPKVCGSPPASNISSTLTFSMLISTSVSVSSISYPSVSYVHSLGPPPLIPRSTEAVSPHPLAPLYSIPSVLPTLSHLNMDTSQPSSRLPIGSTRSIEPLMITPITTAPEVPNHTPQFAASRLPELTLPMFSGHPLEWLTFWDSFRAAIHSNPNLSGVQKFNYLKAQLQGDAAKVITGFPLSDHNYLHAVVILQERFWPN